MTDFYACLELTENEHLVVWDMISCECKKLGIALRYYRKLKDPKTKEENHVPMYREFKVAGAEQQVNRFIAWLKIEKLDDHIKRNPHTLRRKYLQQSELT